MTVDIVGFFAGVLTTVSFVPQVIKVYQTKSAKDLSFSMLVMFIVGIILWLTYGFIINSLPVIISNMITLMLSTILLYFKIRLN